MDQFPVLAVVAGDPAGGGTFLQVVPLVVVGLPLGR